MELLRPYFLLLLPLVALLWWQLKRHHPQQFLQQLIAPHLSKQLVIGNTALQHVNRVIPILFILAIIALSGPSFREIDVPVKQISPARVIVMDMSAHMLATDLKPDRLTQARYKALDLVKQRAEGEQALIAYAGDAFTISPLTSDAGNLLNLIPNLAPTIMPVMGNEPLAGLNLAIELLNNSGYQHGDIIFISGGFSAEQVTKMQSRLQGQPWRVSVLATGTASGAPISLANGDLLKDKQGNIVVAQLDAPAMQKLTRSSGGLYVPLSASARDIQALNNIDLLDTQLSRKGESNDKQANQAVDDGYWLLWLILPFFLLAFRRGQLASIALVGALLLPQTSEASWWQNSQQQAYEKFEQKEYEQAAQQFDDPLWQGSARYKAQDYQGAAEAFSQVDSAQGKYNLGNALAMQQDYKGALEAYEQALKLDPNLQQAKENQAKVADLLKQQEEQAQQNQSSSGSESQDQSQQESSEQEQSPQEPSQDSQSPSEQQNQSQQSGDESQQEQPSQDQQNQDQQDANNETDREADAEAEAKQQEQSSQQNAQPDDAEQTQPSVAPAATQTQASPEPDAPEQNAQAMMAEGESDAAADEGPEIPFLLQQMPDDPAVLLRNKMRLEYQKRQRENR
jgi:Ca-activated chloride channel family protein